MKRSWNYDSDSDENNSHNMFWLMSSKKKRPAVKNQPGYRRIGS